MVTSLNRMDKTYAVRSVRVLASRGCHKTGVIIRDRRVLGWEAVLRSVIPLSKRKRENKGYLSYQSKQLCSGVYLRSHVNKGEGVHIEGWGPH